MSFSNGTNNKRVNSIVDTVALLSKSAASNKATTDEIWDTLSPAMDAISALVGAETQSPDTPTESSSEPVKQKNCLNGRGMKERPWENIKQMAEEASLGDLTIAMAVYLNRIDEAIKERSNEP